MSYGTFIGELKRGIEGQITAYDSKPKHDGCVIYLKKAGERIFVQSKAIDTRRAETISLLRARIRDGLGATPRLSLCVVGEELVFSVDAAKPVPQAKELAAKLENGAPVAIPLPT